MKANAVKGLIAAELIVGIAVLITLAVIASYGWHTVDALDPSAPVVVGALGLPAGIVARLARQAPRMVTTIRLWHGAVRRRVEGRWS